MARRVDFVNVIISRSRDGAGVWLAPTIRAEAACSDAAATLDYEKGSRTLQATIAWDGTRTLNQLATDVVAAIQAQM